MESAFKNDPFSAIYLAFKKLYPDKECEIWYAPKGDEEGYGFTLFPEDEGCPIINIFTDFSTEIQAEILAHELAHVAVGVEHGHDEIWDKAFENIHKVFEKIMEELFE